MAAGVFRCEPAAGARPKKPRPPRGRAGFCTGSIVPADLPL